MVPVELNEVSRVVALATGALRIEVDHAELPLDALCDFATRNNPRRSFLFVSKVLGRHLPVRPAVMRDVWRRLAAKLPADLPGPVVFIGLAETAIALGQGVHASFVEQTGRGDVLFAHSTRYTLPQPLAFGFTEAHSHATAHRVYEPIEAADRALLRAARTLVLVDDEASTGATLADLSRAAALVCPHLGQVFGMVLTDWRGAAAPSDAAHSSDSWDRLEFLSLLTGSYAFTRHPDAVSPQMPQVTGNDAPRPGLMRRNFGRLGLRAAPRLSEAETAALPAVAPGECVLVLGSGEFTWMPFLLAEALAARGADAWVQSTTRSPVQVGQAIASAMTFTDNYDDGIPNFLYNVVPGQYDRVLIGYETAPGSESPVLAATLNASPVYF